MNTLYNTDFNNRTRQTNNYLGDFETIRKVRQDLIGEIQAIIEYDNHIHNSTNTLSVETWKSIKSEELVHVGELLALLNHLDSSQTEYVEEGIREFSERMSRN